MIRILWVAAFLLAISLRGQDSSGGNVENVPESQEADSIRVRELLRTANQLRFTDQDSSLATSRRAIQLAESIDLEIGRAEGFKIIGLVKNAQGLFDEALDIWKLALSTYQAAGDLRGVSNLQSNLGTIYYKLGDTPTALDYFIKSLQNAEAVSDTLRMGTAYLNIGAMYGDNITTFGQAQQNLHRSALMFRAIDYPEGLAVANLNFGELFLKRGNPRAAIPHLTEALEVLREINGNEAAALNFLGDAYRQLGQYDAAERFHGQALEYARSTDARMEEASANLGLAETLLANRDDEEAIGYFRNALDISRSIGVLEMQERAYDGLARTYSRLEDYRNAYTYQQLYAGIHDSLRNVDYRERLTNLNFRLDMKEKENQIEMLNAQNDLNQVQIERDAKAKQLLFITLGLFGIIIAVFIFLYFYVRKSNRRLAFEQDRSEMILLNILPKETAEELKEHGYIKTKEFKQITVLFTDFKMFSIIAERISAEMLVRSVDYYFKNFDAIIDRYNLEKIKTIGDAYMCAGGLPTANTTHAGDALNAAFAIRDFVEETELNPPKSIYPFKVRIGLNSGPVVAGVVGTKKFAYDIWGSTVNIAARMESNSEEGRINVSENTYQILKDTCPFTFRGEIEVKNGQILRMYYADQEAGARDSAEKSVSEAIKN